MWDGCKNISVHPVDMAIILSASKFDRMGSMKKTICLTAAVLATWALFGGGHRAFSIASDPTLSVFDASTRRDFTVNAIYCDPLTGEVEDPHVGLADLDGAIAYFKTNVHTQFKS